MTTPKLYVPEITRLSEKSRHESVTCLWYGPAKTGKTFSALTWGSRTAVIDLNNGVATAMSPLFQKMYPKVDPIIVKVDISGPAAFDNICDSIDYLFKEKADLFDVLVVDSLTDLKTFTSIKGAQLNGDLKRTSTYQGYLKSGIIAMDVNDYQPEQAVMAQFLQLTLIDPCKTQGKHLVVIAHERVGFGKATKMGEAPPINRIRPNFSGQTFPDQGSEKFDLVWYFQAEGKEEGKNQRRYFANTAGSEILLAGTRWGGIFKNQEYNVNLPDVVRRIREQRMDPDEEANFINPTN